MTYVLEYVVEVWRQEVGQVVHHFGQGCHHAHHVQLVPATHQHKGSHTTIYWVTHHYIPGHTSGH